MNNYGLNAGLEEENEDQGQESLSQFFSNEADQKLSSPQPSVKPLDSEPMPEDNLSSYFAQQASSKEEAPEQERLNMFGAMSSGLRAGMSNIPIRALGGAEPLPKEAFPPELRGYYSAAKVISDAVPIAVASTGLTAAAVPAAGATAAKGIFSKAFQPIVQSFAKDPAKFATLEASSILGAAQARGAAESLFPDREFVGTMAEMVGSIANPIGIAYRSARGPISGIYSAFQRLTPKGVKSQASEYIANVAAEFGENPQELAKAIQANRDTPLLPGQVIESKTLNSISKSLNADSEALRNSSREALTAYNEQINRDLAALTSSGDPEALRVAAQIRKDHFGNILNNLIDSAKDDANLAVSRITRNADPAEASEIARQKSDAIQKELQSVFNWGRQVQDDLYPKALKELQKRRPELSDMDTDELYPTTMELFSTVNARILPGENISTTFTRIYGGDVGKSLARLSEIEAPPPIEMYNLAKSAAGKAAKARNAGDIEVAQALEQLNRTILDDIHQIDTPLLDTARDFTAQYRKAFDRTFAKVAVPRTEAEIQADVSGRLMERAIAPGGSRTLANIRDLENAADFNVPSAPPREPTGWVIKNEAEGFLLAHASKFIRDGEVNPAALNNFRARNPELMREFPEVNNLLQNATRTQQTIKRLEKSQNLINKNIVNLNVFQRILNANETNLDQTISKLFSENPQSTARQLSSMIRRFADGSENQVKAAQEGLVSSLIDQAMVKSRIGENAVDWRLARQNLSPELVETLRKNTLITEKQANNLNNIMDKAAEVTRAANNPVEVPLSLDKADLLSAALFRGVGAESFRRAFSNIGLGQGAGPSLVIAQSGAEYMQQKAALDPLGKVKDILIAASLDKDLYADLLRRAPTIESAKKQIKTINSALYAAGITPEEDESFYNYLFEEARQEEQLQGQGQQ